MDFVRCRSVVVVLVSSLYVLIPFASTEAQPLRIDTRKDLVTALAEFDEAQRLQSNEPDRARQLFRLAAQRMESIVAGGVLNGRLEYNLGNCYLQTGNVGRAILHYRRAQRLMPGDDSLAVNLAEARRRCLTNIPRTRRSTFLRSVFFWHYQTSVGARVKTALLAYAGVWVCLILRCFYRRRSLSVAATVLALLAVGVGVSVAATRWIDRSAPEGVITAMDVVVLTGPGSGYQRQFEQPLQSGVEFTLRERRGDWRKIELPDGKSGWVRAAQTEQIPDGGL